MRSLPPGHGFISGATGTGKTTTALRLVAHANALGIASFVVDAKGDLGAALCSLQRAGRLRGDVRLWDVAGRQGHRLNPGIEPRDRVARAVAQILHHPAGAPPVHILAASQLLRTGTNFAEVVAQTVNQLAIGAETTNRPLMVVIEEARLLLCERQPGLSQDSVRLLAQARGAGIRVVAICPDPGILTPDLDAQFAFLVQHALWTWSPAIGEAIARRVAGSRIITTSEAIRGLAIGEAIVLRTADIPPRDLKPRAIAALGAALSDGEIRSVVRSTAYAAGEGRNATLPARRRQERSDRRIRRR